MIRRACLAAIRGYQRWISPLKPPLCRFQPTCSHYAAEALVRHGVIKGLGLATWRLCRCHPFGGSGYDPVPGSRLQDGIQPLDGQRSELDAS